MDNAGRLTRYHSPRHDVVVVGDDAKLETTPVTVGPCPDNDVMNASLFSFCRVLVDGGVGAWGKGVRRGAVQASSRPIEQAHQEPKGSRPIRTGL